MKKLSFSSRILIAVSSFLWIQNLAVAHDGPDPLIHISAKKKFTNSSGLLTAQKGPDFEIKDKFKEGKVGLHFTGSSTPTTLVKADALPKKEFTISSWFSIHKELGYGGVLGVIQDNGGYEKGWVLGYGPEYFYIGLSTKGADDGDGHMIYLESKSAFKLGVFYHVAATYDGEELALYVNGKKESTSKRQSGDILYPDELQLAFAGYRDQDENFGHTGEIVSISVYDETATDEWVRQEFEHNKAWTSIPAPDEIVNPPLEYLIDPYLQFGTQSSMTVMWETSVVADGHLYFGETSDCNTKSGTSSSAKIHELTIKNLKPGTQYFYKTVSIRDDEKIESDVKTFQTDGGPKTPYAFAIISDTQGNPKVSGAIAQLAWEQRPNFMIHPGDLVSTGRIKRQWVEDYFQSMNPLVSRVPFYPVLGNHEQNADHYYRYMSLPEPEYYYTFNYGNAQFFMVDTNKKCDPASEQYKWLEKALKQSKAQWKFACHHHPPYSSDENDYGNLWKTNKSRRGDLNARHLTALYDKYNIDIVWNGHIHSYERTWQIKGGNPVDKDAPFYMITGGGGGGLETPGPFRTPFEHIVKRGHHYCMVWINGSKLSFKAYDLEGKLFDTFELQK